MDSLFSSLNMNYTCFVIHNNNNKKNWDIPAHSCSPPPAQSTTHSTMSSPGSAAAGMWSTCTACCGPQWRSTCSACSWESSLPRSLGHTKIWWGVKKREKKNWSVCLEVKIKVLFGVKDYRKFKDRIFEGRAEGNKKLQHFDAGFLLYSCSYCFLLQSPT